MTDANRCSPPSGQFVRRPAVRGRQRPVSIDVRAIAAANALSDVYAMGAEPLLALNLVGFPDDKLSATVLVDILRGAAEKAQSKPGPLWSNLVTTNCSVALRLERSLDVASLSRESSLLVRCESTS